jgi:hypothetical protein
VGAGGDILTSQYGDTWETQTSGTTHDLFGIAYGHNKFVAVGNNGTVLTSTDGITWSNHSSGRTTDSLRAVVYGKNKFAAVGLNGVILNSGSGASWTRHGGGVSASLYGIAYGENKFAAVGADSEIWTSSNGVVWYRKNYNQGTDLLGTAFGAFKFIAVGAGGELLRSLDGIAWQVQTSNAGGDLDGAIYANERFVAVGAGDIVYSVCAASSPTITVTAPNGGERLEVGSNLSITWSDTGSIDNVKIEYSTDSGTTWDSIIDTIDNSGSYSWDSIPDAPSETCLIRVSDTDGNPSDVNDEFFAIIPQPVGTITVTSPNGGNVLTVSDIERITWTSTGTIEDVTLEYSTDNGLNWIFIDSAASSETGSDNYDWTVPDTPSVQCLVRVTSSASDEGPSDTSDAVFTIESPVTATVTVLTPNGRETIEGETQYEITWSGTGTLQTVTIEYSYDGGTTWVMVSESTGNDGSFWWTVPNTPSPNCLVRITGIDSDDGPSDVSDGEFTITPSTASTLVSQGG